MEFRTWVVSLDMFWAKFPDSTYVKLRVYTLNSRFKDCSFISELKHLADISARKLEDIMKYIFSTRIRNEVMAIG